MKKTECGFCSGQLLPILTLGNMPIVNYFPSRSELAAEKKYPLELCVCGDCELVQLGFIVPPQQIFRSYHFLTSASKPLVGHLQKLADLCRKEFRLDPRSRVLDIGCNDGSLLLEFKKRKIQTLGVEPATAVAQVAQRRGIRVIPEFFNGSLAKEIRNGDGQFDLLSATRVLANIADLNGFMNGVKLLLAPRGVFVAEVNSLSEMLSKFQFDAIYHEHYSYFSFASLQKILKKHGLSIFKFEKSLFQGGELRIFATHTAHVDKELRMEEGITEADYTRFASEVKSFRKNLQKLFLGLKGSTVAGFAAPAKAVTLLNYCGLGTDAIAIIVDSTPFKQGRFLPGLHIPIYPEDYLKGKKIDAVFLLAWNYRDQIVGKIRRLTGKGTKIIVPFPKLETLSL